MEASEAAEQAFAEALARKAVEDFKALGDPTAISHTVQITSFGGSGTTALSASFIEAGLDMPPGPAQWPHKHRRLAPQASEVPDGYRVVYPLGDPRDAVLSLFRRRYQEGHWRAMHHIDDGTPAPAFLDSLDAFVAHGVDEFEMADHVNGWRNHPPGYPVMFVRFDLIDEAWDDIAAFVNLPAGHPRISFEARNSDWRSAPEPTRSMLDAVYGDLAKEIAAMPAVQVI